MCCVSYTLGMKTAISIPDDVFAAADKLARERGQSRSQLYSRAVREYLARHSEDSINLRTSLPQHRLP